MGQFLIAVCRPRALPGARSKVPSFPGCWEGKGKVKGNKTEGKEVYPHRNQVTV